MADNVIPANNGNNNGNSNGGGSSNTDDSLVNCNVTCDKKVWLVKVDVTGMECSKATDYLNKWKDKVKTGISDGLLVYPSNIDIKIV